MVIDFTSTKGSVVSFCVVQAREDAELQGFLLFFFVFLFPSGIVPLGSFLRLHFILYFSPCFVSSPLVAIAVLIGRQIYNLRKPL